MPSSDYHSNPKVLSVVEQLRPHSILDIGVGTGRYGFLFREILDWNYARFRRDDWRTTIDGVEVDKAYISDIHRLVYSSILLGDFLKVEIGCVYDVAFLGDVLEHWAEGAWQEALLKARAHSIYTLVVCPNHEGSMAQGSWNGHEHERHLSLLSPERLGGRCLFANSKIFMVGFDNQGTGALESKDVCL